MTREEVIKKCANNLIVDVEYEACDNFNRQRLSLILENGTIITCVLGQFDEGIIQII